MKNTFQNNTKKYLQTSGIVVAAAMAASLSTYLTTKFLVKAAVDREAPKAMQKAGELLSGVQQDNAFLAELSVAAKRLEGKQHETVEIISRDGTSLVGHFFPSKKPKRIIIAMHGWRTSWAYDFGTMADFLEQNDCRADVGGKYQGTWQTGRATWVTIVRKLTPNPSLPKTGY